jgi:hypothetical protein
MNLKYLIELHLYVYFGKIVDLYRFMRLKLIKKFNYQNLLRKQRVFTFLKSIRTRDQFSCKIFDSFKKFQFMLFVFLHSNDSPPNILTNFCYLYV